MGLDVLRDRIDWCQQYISGPHPSFRFRYLDVYSERYNKAGRPIDKSFRFDFPSDHFDIVYLYGVVTNMTEDHTRIYLQDISRLVKPTGRVFISAFVEENVPNATVNPPGYLGFRFSGPLHHVLYERQYFRLMLEGSGLTIEEEERMPMEYFETQTAFYLEKSQLAAAGNEVKASQQGIATSPETSVERAWHDFCQMLFAANAFLYVD